MSISVPEFSQIAVRKLIRTGVVLLALLVPAACVDVPNIKQPAAQTEARAATQGNEKTGVPLYRAMTREDRLIADRTVRKALDNALSDTTFRWQNPRSGNSGTVTPLGTYTSGNGIFCRIYRENLTIATRTEIYRDQACRDQQGIWRTVRTDPDKES